MKEREPLKQAHAEEGDDVDDQAECQAEPGDVQGLPIHRRTDTGSAPAPIAAGPLVRARG